MPLDSDVGDGQGGQDPGLPGATSQVGESNTGRSSGLFFSVYSKAAADEDKDIVERWQKDAEGILIFTGLFSAAVAALLAVTVQDLKSNSQDTSAFYLGNIYQVLADPNATRSSTPPSFSAPRYAIWVNSLWFLSLVMSLSCALWATSIQQWARRYLHRAQPFRCNPEKRARQRAFFFEGVENMHTPWAVDGLPVLLHLSLFLFFGGVAIFLFHVDREVFGCVIWWICLFTLVYGLITLFPILRHDSPYHSPLSTPAWFLYAGIHHVTFKTLASMTSGNFWSYETQESWEDSRDRYQRWLSGGVEKAAEETTSQRSWEIDEKILKWTLSALGDDDSLKSFFETIPRSYKSTILKDIPWSLRQEILSALHGFNERTLTSNSISDSEKVRRFDISYHAIDQFDDIKSMIMFLFDRRFDVPQTVEMGHTIARWFTDKDIPHHAQGVIASILVNVRERNDSWVALAAQLFGLPEHDLRKNITLGGDNVLLAIFIHVTRQPSRLDSSKILTLRPLSNFNIRNTLPRLQDAFCESWNEILLEAWRDRFSTAIYILKMFLRPYIDLHQGTDAAPTAFDVSTNRLDNILEVPSSYPFCNLASHHPNSTTLPTQSRNPPDVLSSSPTERENTVQQQAEPASNVVEPHPSTPTATSEIGVTSHGHNIAGIPPTNPVDFSSRPTAVSPMAVVFPTPVFPIPQLLQDIAPTATLSYQLDGSEQQDSALVVSGTESETSQILSSSSTNTPTPTPARIPTSPHVTPAKSRDGGGSQSISADPSQVSHFAPPSIGSFILASHPTGSATLPRLRARGLVNTKNICFANTILQLLSNFPPFWNLFRELGDLKGQRGTAVPETSGSTTPLIDATVRFFEEYMAEEQLQPDTDETSRALDSFEPTYLYDAMKEKSQLKPLLDGHQQDAEQFLSLYLNALDEEIPALLASISGHQSAHAPLKVEERDVSQSGQAEVGSQAFVAHSVESPITRIFGGKFRSPARSPNQPDDWLSLHLDIQSDSVLTVQDALMGVSQSQSIQDGTSGLSDASQQMLIEVLPPVLVLRLKRFRENAAPGEAIKIDKRIQISSELEIPSEIMVPDAQRPSEPPRYKLNGVLYHHGESTSSGHYTVDVLHPNGDGATGEDWLHIDDEDVTRMGPVLKFGEYGGWVVDEGSAYLLFYCLTSPISSL